MKEKLLRYRACFVIGETFPFFSVPLYLKVNITLNKTGIAIRLRHIPLYGPWHEPRLQQDWIDVGEEFFREADELRSTLRGPRPRRC